MKLDVLISKVHCAKYNLSSREINVWTSLMKTRCGEKKSTEL